MTKLSKRLEKGITISTNSAITVSLALVLMFAGAVWTGAITVSSWDNRVSALEKQDVEQDKKIIELSSDNVNAKVQLSEIQTQLKNIDTNILDIKQRLTER